MNKLGLFIGSSSFKIDDENDYFINVSFGDIKYFYMLDANLFDVIIVDKCLQKCESFYSILENSKRLLKHEGELILTLPDYRLYEKCLWPSKFNKDHLHSFSINLNRDVVKRDSHWNIQENLIPMLENFEFSNFEVILDDNNFDYDKPVLVNQTKEGASCYIIVKSHYNKKEIKSE
jgi:SAM-dependent methyltransferase